eukprot:1157841-Pelagomonas_calceolata.AAC.5
MQYDVANLCCVVSMIIPVQTSPAELNAQEQHHGGCRSVSCRSCHPYQLPAWRCAFSNNFFPE